jgi:hypothetical protein
MFKIELGDDQKERRGLWRSCSEPNYYNETSLFNRPRWKKYAIRVKNTNGMLQI